MQTNALLSNLFLIFVYIGGIIAFFIVLVYVLINFVRKRNEKKHQYDLTFLQVKVPQQNEVPIEAAEHLFSSLVGLKKPGFKSIFGGQYNISFEIVARKEGIGFFVVVPDEILSFVERQINANYPTAEIDIIDPNEIWDRGAFTTIAEIRLAGASYYPIKTYEEFGETDPLNSITSAISKLQEDDVIALQFLISPASGGWQRAGRAFVGNIRRKSADTEKNYNVDTSLIEGVEKKITKPGFNVSIRVVSIAQDSTSAENHVASVLTSFEQFTDVKYNRFRRYAPFRRKKLIDRFIYRRMYPFSIVIPIFNIQLYTNTSVLNTEELGTVFHFPNETIKTPNIEWLLSRKAPAPTNVPQEGLYMGENVFRGVRTKIHMKPKDRTRHYYIIGQTGTGKSVYMSSLALQDIYNGHGIAYIDPHGSEIDKLLTEIPEHRMQDVILFDASDTKMPLGLNILDAKTDEEKNMIVNSFIALLYKLYDPNRQGIIGPKLERAIRNVMLTAMEDPDSTLVDVLRLLIDSDYQQKFIHLVKDPLVKKYWTDEVAKTSDYHKSETMGYFVSKFDRFVTEKLMRNILGQPKSAINFPEIMANQKILLVDLSKGKIGEENSNFLGLILVPKLLNAALARAHLIGKEEFPDFYLYVDEFQNFATPDFATILSEARKYKLNLTVAHQFVSQLNEEIKEAIFGNVGSMSVFRIGAEDAEFMEPQFDPIFNANDMINNSIGNSITKLLVDGFPSIPFSLRVDYEKIVATPKSDERAAQIREMSRQAYGVPVEQVEKYINDRAGLTPVKETPKKDPKKLIPF